MGRGMVDLWETRKLLFLILGAAYVQVEQIPSVYENPLSNTLIWTVLYVCFPSIKCVRGKKTPSTEGWANEEGVVS